MINRFHASAPMASILADNSQARKAPSGDSFGLLLDAITNPIPDQQREPQNPLQERESGCHLIDGEKLPQLEELGARYLLMAEAKLPISNTENNFYTTGLVVGQSSCTSIDPTSQVPMFGNNDLLQIETSSHDQASVDDFTSSSTPVGSIETMDVAGTEAVNIGAIVPAATDMQVYSRSSVEAGVVELVAAPWRLQANAGMSYRSTLHKFHDLNNAAGQTSRNISAESSDSNARMGSLSSSSVASSYYEVGVTQANLSNKLMHVVSELVDVFEMARTERSNARASMVLWPHRALHWLSDGESTTAWVRDYQLDTNDIKSLIDALHCVAEQQGFTLRRIMLNGHEAWHAPSTF